MTFGKLREIREHMHCLHGLCLDLECSYGCAFNVVLQLLRNLLSDLSNLSDSGLSMNKRGLYWEMMESCFGISDKFKTAHGNL